MLAILLLASPHANAGLKTTGKGDKMGLDPSAFPPNFKAAYELMKVKCTKCHSLERTVTALTTGIAPISGLVFDRSATKAYGIKMMRKPDSNMNIKEIKTVVELLNFLLDETQK